MKESYKSAFEVFSSMTNSWIKMEKLQGMRQNLLSFVMLNNVYINKNKVE